MFRSVSERPVDELIGKDISCSHDRNGNRLPTASDRGGASMIGLLVMSEESFQAHFDQARLDRLKTLVTLPEPIRVDELDSPTARERLIDADVLITSWGVPR